MQDSDKKGEIHMIKELPLLPDTWSNWSWIGNNYINTTGAQTIQAHTTLLAKGLCSDFPKEVWNDFVDLLALALETAGQEWNDTFCTYEECRITEVYGSLTARVFNTVVLNLNLLNIFRYTWEKAGDEPGYLGRRYVRGYSTYGENADYVYAWYILELAQKYDRLINILKNDADFSEFISRYSSKTKSDVSLIAAKSAPLDFKGSSKSVEQADILSLPAAYYRANAVSVSSKHGDLAVAKSTPWGSVGASRSEFHADMLPRVARKLQAHVYTQSSVYAKLSELIYAAEMKFQSSSKSNAYAVMNFYNEVEIACMMISCSISRTVISAYKALQVVAYESSYSYARAWLDTFEILKFSASGFFKSLSDAKITLDDPLQMISCACSGSRITAKAVMLRPNLLYTFGLSDSHVYAEELIRESLPAAAFVLNRTDIKADMQLREVQHIGTAAVSGSISHASPNAVMPAPIVVNACSGAASNTELTAGIPMLLSVETIIQSMSQTEMDIVLSKSAASKVLSYSTVSTDVLRQAVKQLSTGVISNTYVDATLTLYQNEPEEIWYDPEQIGSNLYIRSVFAHSKKESNVNLSFSYYRPEQTGSNVYIRSIESLKGA